MARGRKTFLESLRAAMGTNTAAKVLTSIGLISTLDTFLGYILKGFNYSESFIAIAALIFSLCLAITLILIFRKFKWERPLAWVMLYVLPILSLILAGIVIYTQFFKIDPLIEWNKTVSREVNLCPKEKYRKNKDDIKDSERVVNTACVADSLQNNKIPSHNITLARQKLENELRAGLLLMEDPLIKEVFERRLSVYDTFLGTGNIKSSSETEEYEDARLPEYFIANIKDVNEDGKDRDGIFTWQLSPTYEYLSQCVRCVLFEEHVKDKKKVPPEVPTNKNSDNSETKKRYQTELLIIKNEVFRKDNPILIRFQQFPLDKYEKRTVGQFEANRVFMMRLQDVWNMTIREASAASGHVIDETKTNEKLFIWIYNPSKGSAVPVTWGKILSNPDWLRGRLP